MIPTIADIRIASPFSNADVFTWPVTSRMSVRTLDDKIYFPHTKAGQWPVENPFGDGTLTEGCLWAICQVPGRGWIAGTIDWVRPGQTTKTRPAAEYGPVWKQGFDEYQGPQRGEIVGYFVSTLARMGRTSRVNERSQIVWIRYQTNEVEGEDPPSAEHPGGGMTMGKLPEAVKDTIRRFRATFGDPLTTANPNEADAYIVKAQLFTHRLCEQIRHEHGPAWGHKSAGEGRPHSSDVIAYKSAEGFWGWDLWTSVTSPEQQFVSDPNPIDLTGQIFEPVEPRNWLGTVDPTPDPDPEPDQLANLIAEKVVARLVPFLRDVLNTLEADINRPRKFSFKVFGKTITGTIEGPAE